MRDKKLKVLDKTPVYPAEMVKRVGRDELPEEIFKALKRVKSLDWEPADYPLEYNEHSKNNVWQYIQSTLSK